MATEQLLEKSSVRTDRFSITGFMFAAQGTKIKQNLQTAESNTSDIYRCVGHCTGYTIHSTLYKIQYTQYITRNALYTVNSLHCSQYTIHSTQCN